MEQKYKLKNLTPAEFSCMLSACPQIYELEEISSEECAVAACPGVYRPQGKEDVYVIVGKQLSPADVGLVDKVGKGETVIEVPKGLLANLK